MTYLGKLGGAGGVGCRCCDGELWKCSWSGVTVPEDEETEMSERKYLTC